MGRSPTFGAKDTNADDTNADCSMPHFRCFPYIILQSISIQKLTSIFRKIMYQSVRVVTGTLITTTANFLLRMS